MTPEEREKRNISAERGRIKWIKDNCLRDCSGSDDYLFISYKSDDWKEVLEDRVYPLCRKYGLKVYFDTAFETRTELWIEQYYKNMCSSSCRGVISFQSNAYYRSYACLMEMITASTPDAGDCRELYQFEKFYIKLENLVTYSREENKKNSGLGKLHYKDNGELIDVSSTAKKELEKFNSEYEKLLKLVSRKNEELYNSLDTLHSRDNDAVSSDDPNQHEKVSLSVAQCYAIMDRVLNNVNEAQNDNTGLNIDNIHKMISNKLKDVFIQDWSEPDEKIPRIDDLIETGTEQGKKAAAAGKKYDIKNPEDAQMLLGELYNCFERELESDKVDKYEEEALNLTIRWVFVLYAVDSGLINKNTFKKIFSNETENFEVRLNKFELLFKLVCSDGVLSNGEISRYSFPEKINKNKEKYNIGGDFFSEYSKIVFPKQFSNDTVRAIEDSLNAQNWNEIDPAVFSEMFVDILTPEKVRSDGVHYTSEENIRKLIAPLFLDELEKEFEGLKEECGQNKSSKLTKKLQDKLSKFQKKLGEIKVLDPASGCGNFLILSYSALREIENKLLDLFDDNLSFEGTNLEIKVNINNFYGIEIDEKAAMISRLGMYIAEHKKFSESNLRGHTFLPLKAYSDRIVSANALTIDWEKIVSKKELTYIIGNPPFGGARLMSDEQKKDLVTIFDGVNNNGNLDYVSCWYKKAADMMTDTSIRAALVATNSITQGEQVAILWKTLIEDGVHIDFAHKTFIWDNGASIKAHVHCVIVGFSKAPNNAPKRLFDNGAVKIVNNINGYLVEANDVFIEGRKKPICNVPELEMGNQPIDNGNYLFTKEEYESFIKTEPSSKKYFKLWYGAEEFINNKPRYCLWLGDCSDNEVKKMKHCQKLVDNVMEYRKKSTRKSTRNLANKPRRFQTENMPTSNYIVIPEVSSENRVYIPIGFMTPDVFCSNRLKLMPHATLFHMGVLTSNVHMSWTRAVAGRLEMRFDYSIKIVYNNFPWCDPTPEQKARIEQTAQAILDARALYPDKTLAFLYDPETMPMELRKAHDENDAAVMELYGFSPEISENKIVKRLFEMYTAIVEKPDDEEVNTCSEVSPAEAETEISDSHEEETDAPVEAQTVSEIPEKKKKGRRASSELSKLYNDRKSYSIDLICCFMSKYNNEAVSLLGFTSANKVFESCAKKWKCSSNSIQYYRNTFDPFFDNGRDGLKNIKDAVSSRRKAMIEKFNEFSSADEAYAFINAELGEIKLPQKKR